MRIAVTGGSGRIGQAVIALGLREGHTIVNIDRTPAPEQAGVQFRNVDIQRYEPFAEALSDCEALIHLAAIPSPIGFSDHAVHNLNVVGSYNALIAAAEHGITHVCQASSVNATGAAYSRAPHWDYFPLDELHPTYNEDGYSLSKWICEQQADSVARRYAHMTIASLRFHWIVPSRANAVQRSQQIGSALARHLWGYTQIDEAARACLHAIQANYGNHEVFQIVAPDTMMNEPSRELAKHHYPGVPIRGPFTGNTGFFDCSKAERMLGWQHRQSDSSL